MWLNIHSRFTTIKIYTTLKLHFAEKVNHLFYYYKDLHYSQTKFAGVKKHSSFTTIKIYTTLKHNEFYSFSNLVLLL